MNKDFKYAQDTLIKLAFSTTNKIAVQPMSGGAAPIDVRLPVAEPVTGMFGRWVVEIVGSTVFLRETAGPASSGLILSTQDSGVNVDISYTAPAGSQQSARLNTAEIRVYPREVGKFRVMLSANEESDNYRQLLAAEKEKNLALAAELKLSREKTEQLEDKLRTLAEALNGGTNARTASIESVISTLEAASAQALDKLNSLNAEKDEKERELQRRRDEVASVEHEVTDLERRSEELARRKAELESRLTDLSSRQDFYELDCEEAQKRLDSLNTRCELDSETLALIEDDVFMKRRSVSAAMDQIASEIRSVEKRITHIIRFRERFAANANRASASSVTDGCIDPADEILRVLDNTGGDTDGDGSSAS